jgi:hypothetical protein
MTPPRWLTTLWRFGWLLALGTLLAGCASTLRLEHEVRSQAAWRAAAAPKAGDRYVFERLPSQREAPTAREQDMIEALAQEVLATVGLQPATATEAAQAPWAVQIVLRSVRYPYAPWDAPEPRAGWWPHGQVIVGRGVVSSLGLIWTVPRPPYYVRELSLLVRDRRAGEVVFESRAVQDGPWADDPALWRALLQAALDGFPTPPSGARRVVIEAPRP